MKFWEIHEELPRMPEEFVQRILSIAEDDESFRKHRDRRARTEDSNKRKVIAETHGKSFPKIDLPQDIQDWVKENVTDKFHEVSVRKTIEEGDHHFPHVDITRSWVLMYLLQGGGEDHATVWYKDKDYARPYMGIEYTSYDQLEEVTRLQIPLQTWVLMNASTPHSVENIPGVRIGVTVGLWHDPFDENSLPDCEAVG
jgi:hypothetical protein